MQDCCRIAASNRARLLQVIAARLLQVVTSRKVSLMRLQLASQHSAKAFKSGLHVAYCNALASAGSTMHIPVQRSICERAVSLFASSAKVSSYRVSSYLLQHLVDRRMLDMPDRHCVRMCQTGKESWMRTTASLRKDMKELVSASTRGSTHACTRSR